jgi:heterodisulfide reductase subunit A
MLGDFAKSPLLAQSCGPRFATCFSQDLLTDVLREISMDQQPVEPERKKRALVIGGGIAGIQAALDLANARIPVTLVEKSPSLGGRMAQLDKTFPTMDCAI